MPLSTELERYNRPTIRAHQRVRLQGKVALIVGAELVIDGGITTNPD